MRRRSTENREGNKKKDLRVPPHDVDWELDWTSAPVLIAKMRIIRLTVCALSADWLHIFVFIDRLVWRWLIKIRRCSRCVCIWLRNFLITCAAAAGVIEVSLDSLDNSGNCLTTLKAFEPNTDKWRRSRALILGASAKLKNQSQGLSAMAGYQLWNQANLGDVFAIISNQFRSAACSAQRLISINSWWRLLNFVSNDRTSFCRCMCNGVIYDFFSLNR